MRTFIISCTVFLVFGVITMQSYAQVSVSAPAAAEAPMPVTQPILQPSQTEAPVAVSYSRNIVLPSSANLRLAKNNILIIPGEKVSTEVVSELAEDMAVMSRIFDNKSKQALEQARMTYEMLVHPDKMPYSALYLGMFNPSETKVTQAIYVSGFGMVFTITTNIPIVEPVEVEQQKEPETADEVWRDTKSELLYGESESKEDDRPEYDEMKAENLKTALLETLKHASNIRHLGASELVTVVIKSPKAASEGESAQNRGNVTIVTKGDKGQKTMHVQTKTVSETNVTTIRAKKSDIDDFANDKINLDKFAERIQVVTY